MLDDEPDTPDLELPSLELEPPVLVMLPLVPGAGAA